MSITLIFVAIIIFAAFVAPSILLLISSSIFNRNSKRLRSMRFAHCSDCKRRRRNKQELPRNCSWCARVTGAHYDD